MRYSSKKRKQDGRKKKVIRCSVVNGPVFEYETCPKFKLRSNEVSDAQHNCKNCIYSF